jgi:hypothetical protein
MLRCEILTPGAAMTKKVTAEWGGRCHQQGVVVLLAIGPLIVVGDGRSGTFQPYTRHIEPNRQRLVIADPRGDIDLDLWDGAPKRVGYRHSCSDGR